jgi:hypothetical protein
VARRNGVSVIYRRGGGTYYTDDDSKKAIYIDTTETAVGRANAYVHEVNHARNHGTPDIKTTERQAYIDASIDEEVTGQIAAIKNNQQLQRARGDNPPVPNHRLQQDYEAGYTSAIRLANRQRAQKGQPPLTEDEARRAGEAGGRRQVRNAFVNGEVLTSTSRETYPKFYGKAWDEAHKN